jgi:hypothetical protein
MTGARRAIVIFLIAFGVASSIAALTTVRWVKAEASAAPHQINRVS